MWILPVAALLIQTSFSSIFVGEDFEVHAYTNDEKQSMALPSIVNAVSQYKEFQLILVPESIKYTYTCEEFHYKGSSPKELLTQYTTQYSQCFIFEEVDPQTFLLTPNFNESSMLEDDGFWHCSCK